MDDRRFTPEAFLPLLGGLAWLWSAPGHGFGGLLLALLPGALQLGAGVAMLLLPGDRRIPQLAATGGAIGFLLGLVALFAFGPAPGLMLLALSAAAFVAAGIHSVKLEPAIEGVPELQRSLRLASEVAVDQVLLTDLVTSLPLPKRRDHERIADEARRARKLFAARGWLEKPERYHVDPPPLDEPEIRPARLRNLAYEHLSFESGYAPHEDEPGRERWLSFAANRTAHAWVVRPDREPRPWLLCIHGYVMGSPAIDLGAFPPAFYGKLGVNLIVPTLPLHGRRKLGRRSGAGYLKGDVMDTIHAEAQAVWDLRRCLSWVRTQTDQPVGVYGLSLGGYNAALLSCFDAELACVIAGIPVTDFARIVHHHGPPLTTRAAVELGLDEERVRELKRVVSPLDLESKVPRERRYLFGGTADRIVPADHVRDLWRHWDEPEIVWYPGAHVTFPAHPDVRKLLHRALRESGIARGQD